MGVGGGRRKKEIEESLMSSSIIVYTRHYTMVGACWMSSLPTRPLFSCHLIDRAKILKKKRTNERKQNKKNKINRR